MKSLKLPKCYNFQVLVEINHLKYLFFSRLFIFCIILSSVIYILLYLFSTQIEFSFISIVVFSHLDNFSLRDRREELMKLKIKCIKFSKQ